MLRWFEYNFWSILHLYFTHFADSFNKQVTSEEHHKKFSEAENNSSVLQLSQIILNCLFLKLSPEIWNSLYI